MQLSSFLHFFKQSRESLAGTDPKKILSIHSPGSSQIWLVATKIKVENKMVCTVFIIVKQFQQTRINYCMNMTYDFSIAFTIY